MKKHVYYRCLLAPCNSVRTTLPS